MTKSEKLKQRWAETAKLDAELKKLGPLTAESYGMVGAGGPITREVVAAGMAALKANRPPRDHVYGCSCDLCEPITLARVVKEGHGLDR